MSTIESSMGLTRGDGNLPSSGASAGLAPALAANRPSLLSCLDWTERLLVLVFYLWLVARLLGNYWTDGQWGTLLLLPSEGLVVLFLLLRRPARTISTHPGEWLLALAGTCSALLVRPEATGALVSPLVGGTLILMGMVVQLLAKITLGRSLGCVPAHRGLRLKGPYHFVRHPMYAGYALSHIGFLLMNPTMWNLIMYLGCECIMVLRLLAEERLLSSDPHYRAYRTKVRYRLVPGLF